MAVDTLARQIITIRIIDYTSYQRIIVFHEG